MADDKIIRCDCGYRLGAGAEQRQVAEVRRHTWETHGISISTEEALAVLLRIERECRPTSRWSKTPNEEKETQ